MGIRGNHAVPTGGRQDRRLETVVNREIDAGITLLAERDGCNRSEAARRLLAAGIEAERLGAEANRAARESRERDAAERCTQTEKAA